MSRLWITKSCDNCCYSICCFNYGQRKSNIIIFELSENGICRDSFNRAIAGHTKKKTNIAKIRKINWEMWSWLMQWDITLLYAYTIISAIIFHAGHLTLNGNIDTIERNEKKQIKQIFSRTRRAYVSSPTPLRLCDCSLCSGQINK